MSITGVVFIVVFITLCMTTFIFGGLMMYYFFKVLETNSNRYSNLVPLLVLFPNTHRGEAREHCIRFLKFFLLGSASCIGAVLINYLLV